MATTRIELKAIENRTPTLDSSSDTTMDWKTHLEEVKKAKLEFIQKDRELEKAKQDARAAFDHWEKLVQIGTLTAAETELEAAFLPAEQVKDALDVNKLRMAFLSEQQKNINLFKSYSDEVKEELALQTKSELAATIPQNETSTLKSSLLFWSRTPINSFNYLYTRLLPAKTSQDETGDVKYKPLF